MREMKDSGIPWIGEIPSDWKILRLKQLLANEKDAIKVGPFGSQLSGSDFTNDGFWVYNQQTVINHDFSKNDTFINHEKFNAMKSFQVRASDILITTRGTIGKICRIPKNFHEGIIHPCIIKFRIDDTKILYNIIEMLFNNSDLVKNQLNYMSNATTIDVIYSSTLKNIYIPVAPIKVQRRIADYLDTKCARIDSIRKNVEAEIEALKQYKQSVITEAVTKGLDKNVEMKDSEVDWNVKIPQNWNISRLGFESYIRARLGWKGLKANEYVDEGYAFISAFNIQSGKLLWNPLNYITKERYDESPEIKLKVGDVLIVKDGAGVGKVARIDDLPKGEASPNSSIGVITPYKKLDYKYLAYYLQSSTFNHFVQKLLNGMGVPHLTQEILRKIYIFIPHIKEQQQIADYLDTKCSKIDSIIHKKQELLTKLDTYKKSLIYEYVTGKKEVPAV